MLFLNYSKKLCIFEFWKSVFSFVGVNSTVGY